MEFSLFAFNYGKFSIKAPFAMNAISYKGLRFFAGLQLIAGMNCIPLEKELKGSIVEGKSALFVGYRF